MRKLIFITIVCAFLTAPAALADYYGGTAMWEQVYSQGQGGEFRIRPDGPPGFYLSNSAYADDTKNQGAAGSFQTFCVETGEFIYEPMHIKVSETFVNGNPGSHAWQGGVLSVGDDLNSDTAYYYTQFATGTLSGYAYSETVGGLNRSQTAGALQRLIWNIEGEGGALTAASTWYGITLTTAQANLIASWQTAYTTSGWTGIGNVRVLQTYQNYNPTTGDYSGLKQDQLYLVPVPGAVLLGMLGLGAAGMKLRKFV
jgi:hypothetical protein